MVDDFPDLHHKLCKKLAHLTTGFYHLNLKSDETDSIIQNVINTYEEEMDKIVQTANEILNKNINENPQQKEVHEIHTSYQTFKQEFEHERNASIEEFNNYIKAVEEDKRKLEEGTQNQIDTYQREVDELKEKLKYMHSLVEKALGKEVGLEDPEKKAW